MVRPIKNSSVQLPQTNHTPVSRYRHCDGEVVIHSANGHLVLITHLLSSNKIRTRLGTFYTMNHTMLRVVILLRSTPLLYHIRKLMTHKRVLRPMKPGLRLVSKQFANVPQQSCTRDRKFGKTFAHVSVLNASPHLAWPLAYGSGKPECLKRITHVHLGSSYSHSDRLEGWGAYICICELYFMFMGTVIYAYVSSDFIGENV